MHPRTLAKDGCTGGSCPAVYDSDPDLLQTEIGIVGSLRAPSLRQRLRDQIAASEQIIVIDRDLVERALRPADEPVAPEEFGALFTTFSYSAFRLETLQHYEGTGPDPEWAAIVKTNLRWRKVHQRVHVVTEPLSASMLEELTEGYPGSVAAGEDIRIVPPQWLATVPPGDFWLFDSSRLYAMRYEPDGKFAGAVRVRDPQQVVEACRARDEALHRAIPWRAYIASRPELQSRIAQ